MATAESAPARTSSTARGITSHGLVARTSLRLNRDPSRVVAKLFAPGAQPAAPGDRAAHVMDQVLSLSDAEVAETYAATVEAFGGRHRHLERTFGEDFDAMRHRVQAADELDDDRRLLVGALFTHEVAIEGAALTNPSMVPHPDQAGLGPDECRFVMSARAIGEGHVSSVEFRTGVVTADGEITVDEPSPFATCGTLQSVTYRRRLLAAALDRPEDDDEALAFLLRRLPEEFIDADVEEALAALPPQLRVLSGTQRTISDVQWFLACQYRQKFEDAGGISERTLWPLAPTEQHGMEDARFVRFLDADGEMDYRATYTANDGSEDRIQMIRTRDFQTFSTSQIFGKAAGNKDLALFPRQVGGRYLAMSRFDREHNAVAFSDDAETWPEATVLHVPSRPWRLMQAGNCGSPIETEAGWLVLTHGVGPMRAYSLGALLLDLEDPTRIIGELEEPLLVSSPGDRDGYVPNVVYSCGAMRWGDLLVVPYGFGDMGIEFATVPLGRLLAVLVG